LHGFWFVESFGRRLLAIQKTKVRGTQASMGSFHRTNLV
jgi:hypothetical protein